MRPCYIATKGRAGKSSTIEALIKESIDHFLVVEPQELEDYKGHYPDSKVLILPKNDGGITLARNFCLNSARHSGVDCFWMLDDDIKQLYGVTGGKCIKQSFKSVFEDAEICLSRVPNLAIGSLEYQQYAWSAKKPYALNSYCDVAVYINIARTAHFDYREDCKEDRDFVLQALALGYTTARTSWLAFSAPKNGSNKGGLHEAYKGGLEKHWSARMVELWPGICEFKPKKDGRPDVKIHWRKMKKT